MKVTIKNTAASIRVLRIAALIGLAEVAILLFASQAGNIRLLTAL